VLPRTSSPLRPLVAAWHVALPAVGAPAGRRGRTMAAVTAHVAIATQRGGRYL